MTDKVAADVCEKEFQRMCVKRRIDTDVAAMTKVDQRTFEAYKKALVKVMARGELVVSKEGNELEFTPPGGTKITFYETDGAVLMAQDGFGPNDDVARAVAVATALTKSAPGALSKLHLIDFGVVSDVTNFLIRRW